MLGQYTNGQIPGFAHGISLRILPLAFLHSFIITCRVSAQTGCGIVVSICALVGGGTQNLSYVHWTEIFYLIFFFSGYCYIFCILYVFVQ